MELLQIAIIMSLLAAFAILANELGVDSRDFTDDPHSNFPIGVH